MTAESTDGPKSLVAALTGAAVPSSLTDVLRQPAQQVDIAQFVALRAAACVGPTTQTWR